MPPQAKITKEMILNAALRLTKRAGFEAVNARSIAAELQCSTRPIFTCYKNMDMLKHEFLDFAFAFYEQYVMAGIVSVKTRSYLLHPLSYIAFAQEETNLFKLLFISDMQLDMATACDFYKEPGNERNAAEFAGFLRLEPDFAKMVFLDLFFYAHGIAVLTATKKVSLDRDSAERMLANMLTALVRQKNPGWEPPA